ncbi:hypothetical protein N7E70_015980 [Aminobacter sp. NyZ550]|uniref:hypothetical protein n=1 Tax=Aminobacter sp. NyZ550 TaxID=2979870 RepID=UPI0021D5B16B|nr:hypothetical protein [Aminobacter sp. NyZ550]WAX93197.1 hypothetical protein N7E70_015980 [Aminobacter sp. NyZ550]
MIMSSLSVNGARGEVALRIGSVDLVIAAEIGRLAAVSTALECKSLPDLYQRLLGVEVAATIAGVQHLAVQGDVAAALRDLKLRDFPACKTAFAAALNHHLDDTSGKGGAAGEAAKGRKRKV